MANPADLSRGDIWHVQFGEDIGRHPGVLVGRTGAMRRRHRAIVALCTSAGIGLPTQVPIGPEHGLDHDSVVDCEDLYTVGIDLLDHRAGRLDEDTLSAVDDALRIALDLH